MLSALPSAVAFFTQAPSAFHNLPDDTGLCNYLTIDGLKKEPYVVVKSVAL